MSNTARPRQARTSSATCCESLLRRSNMVSATPRICSSGIEGQADALDRLEKLAEPLEREELALQRHEQVPRGHQGIDRQQAERRRAVDQADVPAARRHSVRAPCSSRCARSSRRDELDLGAGQVHRRRQQVEPRHARGDRRSRPRRHCRSARRSSTARGRAWPTPSPVDALPCGSRSISSTFQPIAASAVARLIAVVVLPTPPFWFATATLIIASSSPPPLSAPGSGIPDPCTLCSTVNVTVPVSLRLRQFRFAHSCPWEAPRPSLLWTDGARYRKQSVERRDRASGDHVELALDALDLCAVDRDPFDEPKRLRRSLQESARRRRGSIRVTGPSTRRR